jgi:hypothetical protein
MVASPDQPKAPRSRRVLILPCLTASQPGCLPMETTRVRSRGRSSWNFAGVIRLSSHTETPCVSGQRFADEAARRSCSAARLWSRLPGVRMRFQSRVALSLACALGLFGAAAQPGAAQSAGDGFLFSPPTGSFSVFGGMSRATAGSDIFAHTTEHLTLQRGDFDGASLGGDLAFRLRPRLDLVLGSSYTSSVASSESRHYVYPDDRPIEQTTTYTRVPVTVGLKAYLSPPGRSVSRYAWVPARYAPFVGLSVGGVWYNFHQEGMWVDFEDLGIFPATMSSSGWAPAAQASAGVDLSLTTRLALVGETRYLYSRADLGNDFRGGFEPIDLSGLSASLGLSLRF